MDAITLDQYAVFTTVAGTGSFAAAARRLNRAQSAITYAIQNLETQCGVALFDRTTYRASLTAEGAALLPLARQVLESSAAFRQQAQQIAGGLEAQLTLVLEFFAPTPPLRVALRHLQARYPLVQVRIVSEMTMHGTKRLAEGGADVGLLFGLSLAGGRFITHHFADIELVAVASPSHPLASLLGPIPPETLQAHIQVILSAHSTAPTGPAFGIQAINRWYVTEPRQKHDFLLAGLGWGSLPRHWLEEDLAAGRLIELQPQSWDGADTMPRLPCVVAYRRDHPLGPAGRALVEALRGADPPDQPGGGLI